MKYSLIILLLFSANVHAVDIYGLWALPHSIWHNQIVWSVWNEDNQTPHDFSDDVDEYIIMRNQVEIHRQVGGKFFSTAYVYYDRAIGATSIGAWYTLKVIYNNGVEETLAETYCNRKRF